MSDEIAKWQAEYEGLEKENDPFKIVFRILGIMLKAVLEGLRMLVIMVKKVTLWMLKRSQKTAQSRQPQQETPYYYRNQAS